MKTLARQPEKTLTCCPEPSDKVYYPCFYVDGVQMPDIKNMKPGDEHVMVFKIRVRSISLSNDDKASGEIELLEYDTKIPKSLN